MAITFDPASVTEEEIWVPIPCYEERYEVSNLGRIQSLINIDSIGGPRLPKIIKPVIEKRKGIGIRSRVHLTDGHGNKRIFKIHYLVMLSFNGKAKDGFLIRHLDGNGLNNRLDNLSFGTQKENMADAILHGTTVRGSKSCKAVLSEEMVLIIKTTDFSVRGSQLRFCLEHNINPSTLNSILKGRIWKWL